MTEKKTIAKNQITDCKWYDPFAAKKPIAYSTISTAEHIRFDAKDYATLNQLREKYSANGLCDEELAVIEAYVKRGYGGIPAKLAIKYQCL